MKRILILAVAVLALGATGAAAQVGTRTATATFSATIPEILSIASAGNFTFNSADEADFTAGHMSSITGPTLTHYGNVNYKITAEGAAATLAGGAGTKPISDVLLDGGTEGQHALVSGTPVDLDLHNAGPSSTTTMSAQMLVAYANDTPATYTTTITFTIVAQ